MEQFFSSIFGVENHLSVAQEVARAGLIFGYGLLLLRLSGPRLFGNWSALDVIMTIMVGSALARTMTGGAPLLGTMAAAAVLAFLHAALAHCVARNTRLAHWIEGKAFMVIDHGRIDHDARRRHRISEADLREALRQQGIDGEAHVNNVKLMALEPSGKLSVVKIDPCEGDHS
jgi:uncharacterized membrane protein YcaP (DUF421 family)